MIRILKESSTKYSSTYMNVQGFSFDFEWDDDYNPREVMNVVADAFRKNGCEVEAFDFEHVDYGEGRNTSQCDLDISFNRVYDTNSLIDDLSDGLDSIGLEFLGFDTYSVSEYYECKKPSVKKESYDPFKDLRKSPNGQYTDGRGSRYDVDRSKSDVITFNKKNFQYDYDHSMLLWIGSDGEEIDGIGLSVGNWLDQPDYWIERYSEEIDEETQFMMDYERM